MRAFENWKKTFYRNNDPLPSPNDEEAWRAALEWILDKCLYKDYIEEIQAVITNELNSSS